MNIEPNEIPLLLITTSNRKADHIQYLCRQHDLRRNHGLVLTHTPLEYQEIQSDDMELLLSEANDRQIFDGIRDCFFLIEQTSVFLDAKDGEGPGQYFKKWWNTKSEKDLQRAFSRNPGATIESGLSLNIPGHPPLIFTNKQRGKISLDGSVHPENKQYSWLSADDFNLYFVPEGSNKVYNEMPISEFLECDFRKPNFDKIAQRLAEYSSIIRQGLTPDGMQKTVQENLDDYSIGPSETAEQSLRDPGQTSLDNIPEG